MDTASASTSTTTPAPPLGIPVPVPVHGQAGRLHTHVSVSGVTDPGQRGKQNQDAFFTLHDPDNQAMVLGVFDGHGRDTGKDAAMNAKAFFEAHFRSFTADDYAHLEEDPHGVLTQLFRTCHEMIKSIFRSIYEHRGYKVVEEDGLLVRKDHDDEDDGVCIRGGTTATIVVILHGGDKIITANVGDSAALIGTGGGDALLSVNDVQPCVSNSKFPHNKKKTHAVTRRFDDEIKNECVLLTGNHSADSESEFLRVRKHSYGSPDSQVQFIYDCCSRRNVASSYASSRCQPIFNVSPRGLVQQNMVGDYYKNVRDEWATMVTTPVEAPFPESLAFTRSLGDFNMHNYGVSTEPTVQEISLKNVLTLTKPQQLSPTGVHDSTHATSVAPLSSPEPIDFYLVVASDGVWDNWKYDELIEFLVTKNASAISEDTTGQAPVFAFWPVSPRTPHVNDAPLKQSSVTTHIHSHIDRLASALMDANIERADRIFGDQADNMTAIVCKIHFSHR